MCCCDQPNVNGQPGYKWQPNDSPRVRPVNPPALDEHDKLLYDEPGRCGGLDSHCHHYRVALKYGSFYLLVRHGGGDERIRLADTPSLLDTLASLDSTARYWVLNTIYHAHSDGARQAADKCNGTWTQAAAEKRIKTRKNARRGTVKVWVEAAKVPSDGEFIVIRD